MGGIFKKSGGGASTPAAVWVHPHPVREPYGARGV